MFQIRVVSNDRSRGQKTSRFLSGPTKLFGTKREQNNKISISSYAFFYQMGMPIKKKKTLSTEKLPKEWVSRRL